MRYSVSIVLWALSLGFVLASAPVDYTVRTHNAPGSSVADVHKAIRREIAKAATEKREKPAKHSTTLDRSWNGAVLLKFGGERAVRETNASSLSVSGDVEIVCTTCYIKGNAMAEFEIQDDFNASQAIHRTSQQIQGAVENLTDNVEHYFINYTKGLSSKFSDGISLDDFALPTFPYNFSLTIPEIPECNLKFQFDDLELYMAIDTILGIGATYELNLYSSNTPLGISITKDLHLGVIFSIDLILAIDGKIDISSGFHLKVDDGLAINIALFSDDVSEIIFNGGKFEFLPVKIQSAGVIFSAVLRVGVHVGFELVTPDLPKISVLNHTLGVPSVGGGIEVGVFANVAEFITNVTHDPKADCQLKIVQSYQLALGAAAGATVSIDSYIWGPVATTSIPIFTTELAEACAVQKTTTTKPEITAAPSAVKRADLETITTTVKITHTGVWCNIPGKANCPVAAQNTSQSIETTVITTALPSGSTFVIPAAITNTVSTIAFGSDVRSLPKTSGGPISYTAPPTPTASSGDKDGHISALEEKVGGVSKNVIVGVSVGVGVPVILALIGAIFFLRRRSKYASVSKTDGVPMFAEPYGHDHGDYTDKMPAKPTVRVTEVEQH